MKPTIEYIEPLRYKTATVRLNPDECNALQAMAHNLGVTKSDLIREGLERVYREYNHIKAAAHGRNQESATA